MSDWIEKYKPFNLSGIIPDNIKQSAAPLLLMDIDVKSDLGRIFIGHKKGKNDDGKKVFVGGELIDGWCKKNFHLEILQDIENNKPSFVVLFKKYLEIYGAILASDLMNSANTRKPKRFYYVKVTEFIDWARRNNLEINDKIKAAYVQTELQVPVNTDKVSQCFAPFKNLRARDVSLVVLKNDTVKIVIRGKTVLVSPYELGLTANGQGWYLLQSAAANEGCLANAVKQLNSTSDLEAEKGKIKTAISYLRKNLKKAMGLMDDPIIYKKGMGYNFTFHAMTHEIFSGSNVSKGRDALDYPDNDERFDENQHGSSDDDEEDDYID